VPCGGAQMVRVCSGDTLPHGVKGKWYLPRPYGNSAHEIYDVTDPAKPRQLVTIVDGLRGTHKSWWKCKKAGVTNNVEIDDRGLIYGADRAGGGLHILRLTGAAKEIVSSPASN
jgi:hypothetical protein